MVYLYSVGCAFTVLGPSVHTSNTLLKTSCSQPTHLNLKNGYEAMGTV